MNKMEFKKKSKEYKDIFKKIKNYHEGFKFTLPYYKMTQGQKNAINIITSDCIKERIIDSVSIGLNLSGELQKKHLLDCKSKEK